MTRFNLIMIKTLRSKLCKNKWIPCIKTMFMSYWNFLKEEKYKKNWVFKLKRHGGKLLKYKA